jgi:RNA polymerase sigma-70 factor (ECF subfamily)
VTRLAQIDLDPAVLDRARRGDDRARAQLYGAVAGPAFTLIRRIVGQRALAEDLFQDTMVTALERLADFRGEAPLGAWIRSIAVTRCLMHLRSPWHRARLGLAQAVGFDGEGDAPPSERLVASPAVPETLDVERALATLAPTARAVVWLYEVEGYTHEEIAGAFGRSVSFSKSQLARAHRRLREWFDTEVTSDHVVRVETADPQG